MNNGLVKVATASPFLKVADCTGNTEKIISEIKKASELGVKLLVFPELCITSASCGELFRQRVLIDNALIGLKKTAEMTKGQDILVIIGLPIISNGSLYNCAAAVQNGKVLGFIPKTAVSGNSGFCDARYFAPARNGVSYVDFFGDKVPFGKGIIFESETMPEFKVGVEIGDDVSLVSPPSADYAVSGASVIVNISASNEIVGKSEQIKTLVSAYSKKLICAYIYANASGGESSTDLVFSGHSLTAENGKILAETELFESKMNITEIDLERLTHDRLRNGNFVTKSAEFSVSFTQKICKTKLTRKISRLPFVPEKPSERSERMSLIFKMQSEGLRKRISHINCKKIVVGISGGLDSALALIVMANSMDRLGRDRKDIIAVTMPCFGTTKRTKSNAEKLCDGLGVTFKEVAIRDAVIQHFKDIGQDAENYDVTYENSQARERTQVLMDIANQNGGIVIGTGDLSELALGWATYNGDHMSMYGVNSSVPKTLVRHIVRSYADSSDSEEVRLSLYDILDTPVSPELIPPKDGEISQVTETLVGPYELHDFFLYYYVRYGFSPEKILRLALYAFENDYSEETIKGWLSVFLRRFITQQFKRSCVPDGPKVGTVSLSPRGDWQMPSDASADIWRI